MKKALQTNDLTLTPVLFGREVLNMNITINRMPIKQGFTCCFKHLFLLALLLGVSQSYIFAAAPLTVKEVAFWSDLGLSDAAIAAKLAAASPRPRFSEADLEWLRTTAAKPGLIETIRPYVPKAGTQGDGNSPRGDGNSPPSASGNLTGLWRNPGANAVYRVRQVGSKVVWGIDAVSMGSYANVFQGQMTGNNIDGVWEDLPGSPTIGGGRMLLKVESNCRFIRVSSVNPYGADVWVKKDSLCDVVGMQQQTGSVGDKVVVTDPFKPPAKPAEKPTATKNKPKVEEIPDGVIDSGPTGKTTTAGTNTNRSTKPVPKVEDIPDSGTTATTTKKPTRQKPKVEEIPDGEITVAKNDDDNNVFINETTTKAEQTPPVRQQPQPKQEKPAKPKRTGPSIWEKLGTAINTAVTQLPPPTTGGTTEQPPPTTGGTTQQQPDGSCRGGTAWLGTPVPIKSGGVTIPFSTPIGAPAYTIQIFSAGTNQMVTWGFVDKGKNSCGMSWAIYPPKGGSYDAYLHVMSEQDMYKAVGRVYGPVRFNY